MKLAFDSYTWSLPETNPVVVYSGIADDWFNYLFILEMTSKLIAMGIIMDEGSTSKNGWEREGSKIPIWFFQKLKFDFLVGGLIISTYVAYK